MDTSRVCLEITNHISNEIDFIIPLKTLNPMVISQLLFFFFRNKKKLSKKEGILWVKNRKRQSIACALPLQIIFSSRPHIYSPEEALCL
jgi:hypothetical protein